MIPTTILFFAACIASATEDPTLVAPTPPRTPEEQQKMFHLPPGFEIQLVAAEPQIAKPMNIAFDDRSRLWVTDSLEYPFPAKAGETPRDTIKILEDTDGDGRADRVKTFVDGLNIPIGILPQSAAKGGGCVAYSIPSIYRFADRDADDRADARDVLYTGFGFADTHGMSSSYSWGFDGWIYATHGFANNSEVKGSDGHVVKMNSGNTYRFRPDGSRIEQWTWGQVNPFGLAFDPLGNLYSADCHSRPVMMLLRGAYYQSFGKPHDGLGYGPEICTHDHGSTGIAGIVWYAADQFPREYFGTIFSGNPVTNRINHDRLDQHGSTFQTAHQPDFLTCDDPWFRPVSLTLGPDGAIYVADFYNKIIGHYEVPLTHPGRDRNRGRIWRIVYRGDLASPPPSSRRNWETASIGELVDDLASRNLAVRTKATNQLVDRIGPAATDPLRKLLATSNDAIQRTHAMWALERIGGIDDALLGEFLDDQRIIPAHALMLAGERRELSTDQRRRVLAKLNVASGLHRRAAADALARHPATENIEPLLKLRRSAPTQDIQLLHATRMALRDQLRTPGAFDFVFGLNLNDADGGNLADVVPGISSPAAARWLLSYLFDNPKDAGNFHRYLAHIARNLPVEQEQDLLDFARETGGGDLRRQAATIGVLADAFQARGGKRPDYLHSWAVGVTLAMLDANDLDSAREAIRLVRSMKIIVHYENLTAIAAGKKPFETLRAEAISALAEIHPDQALPFLSGILGNAAEPLVLRQHVATTLGLRQQPEVHAELVRHLRLASEELGVHIASGLAGGRGGAEILLAEIASGKASPRLLLHPLVNRRVRASRVPEIELRIAKLTEGYPPAEERLQQLIQTRRAGFAKSNADAERGAKIFEKHCAACHTIASRGTKIGPQLDGIGLRGIDRILEDVLDPNRNVDQAFRSSSLALKNGQVLTGLVLATDGEVVVLADAQGKEVRIPKSDIEEQALSKLSPMPANVAELVSEPDFFDLVAYLRAQQSDPPPAGK